MEPMSLLSRRAQRGLSLIYALLSLAALTLATVAMMRAVSTGALVAGNLSFQEDATATADQATRLAMASIHTVLLANAHGLDGDIPGSGYYASTNPLLDVTGNQQTVNTRMLVNWGDACAEETSGSYASCTYSSFNLATRINGNQARYIVFRLCDAAGAVTVATSNCAYPLTASSASTTNEGRNYNTGKGAAATASTPYYRIVVRVAGARNTVSYTESIVHF